jgi:hypothetical protein
MMDRTMRALIGFVGYLYNERISKAYLNNDAYRKIVTELDRDLLSLPVSLWTDPQVVQKYISDAASKLELDFVELNRHLMRMGVSYDPANRVVV